MQTLRNLMVGHWPLLEIGINTQKKRGTINTQHNEHTTLLIMKSILTSIFLCLITLTSVLGQLSTQGIIRGSIKDGNSGETIPFANIIVENTTIGTTSDLDGAFELALEKGMYTLTVSFIGFSEYKVTDVLVEQGNVLVLDIVLDEEGELLNEIVVTAREIRDNDIGVLTLQRKSANVVDGISAASFKRVGDSNAGEALKRVTGVSVEGGKYVSVRGLGDRYSKTLLNGMEIPGLDPDRNAVEVDIFPTSVIGNMMVYKTFSPDLAGDFSGGIVDVVTKDFPDEKFTQVGLSLGYAPSQHFRSDFLDYQGGKTDWLGMDDGTRSIPFSPNSALPDESRNDPILETATRGFDNQMAANPTKNNLNKGISFSHGNRFKANDLTLSYIISGGLKESFKHFSDASYALFLMPNDETAGLEKDVEGKGSISETSNFVNGLIGFSAKMSNHRVNAKLLQLQNGVSTSANFRQSSFIDNPSTIVKDNIEFNQRSVTNILVDGRHLLGDDGKFELHWKYAPTFINVEDPDIRYSAFEELTNGDDVSYQLAPSVGASASRTFRYLNETAHNAKLDFVIKLGEAENKKTKIKFGANFLTKKRDFAIHNYLVRVIKQGSFDFNGDPNKLFASENIWTPETQSGTYIRGNKELANIYEASQNIFAAYAMNELYVTPRLKAVYGLRMEKTDNYYTGQNNLGSIKYDNQKVLEELDFLPSLNLVYELTDMMNLRASANRTLARPSFKEKSIAQISDRITGRAFVGNIDLEDTKIMNYDLRWEYFYKPGQLVSLSGFYKSYDKPIELTPFASFAPNTTTPRNQGESYILGVEFEYRTRLGGISPVLENLSFNSNVTYIMANVRTLDQEGNFAGDRDAFIGLSPFSFNTGMSYFNPETSLEMSLNYNYQGRRLAIAGIDPISDVYETAFHSLKFKISKSFGRTKIGLSLDNILDQSKSKEYDWIHGNEIYEYRNEGRSFGFSLSYTL